MAEYVLYLTTPQDIAAISPIIVSDILYDKINTNSPYYTLINSESSISNIQSLDNRIFDSLNSVIPDIMSGAPFYKTCTNTVYFPQNSVSPNWNFDGLQNAYMEGILNVIFPGIKIGGASDLLSISTTNNLTNYKIKDRQGFEFTVCWNYLRKTNYDYVWGASEANNQNTNTVRFPFTAIELYNYTQREVSFDFVSVNFPIMPSNCFENGVMVNTIPDDYTKNGFLRIEILFNEDTRTYRYDINVSNSVYIHICENGTKVNYERISQSVFTYYNSYGNFDSGGYLPTPDPYSPGGTSGTGGGGGTYNTDSDSVPVPSLPALDAVKAGFISLYSPTLTQLNNLASYMWSDSFDVNTFKKIFADPMDAIIGLSIVPGNVPTAGTDSIKIGFIDTGVSMNKAATQYASLDCGTLDIQNFFGSFLDYSPYTKFSIFLPYIGTRQLDTDDIMGKQLHLVYNIDYLTGTLCAMLEINGAVLYEFSGSCAASIPLTGQNFTQMIVSGIQLATSITAGVATAGATTAANVASTAGMLGSTAGTVAGMKPSIQKTGAVSGAAGMLGVQTPYLIWEIPRQALPENFNTFYGYPANITKVLKDCSGYTEIDDIHIYNIYATDAELREIESLLKGGVII